MPHEDYLPGTSYTVMQPADFYHFSSDAELLGSSLIIKKTDRVLDIGCGTGVLLLYAALHKPALLCGIDLFPEVIETARDNLARNGLDAELYAVKAQEFRHAPFDVIICNPPYFDTVSSDLINENQYLAAARHSVYLPIEELFQSVKRLLGEKGTFWLVQRPEALNRILKAAYDNRLCLSSQQYIYDRSTGKCRTMILSFRFGTKRDVETKAPLYR